MAEEVITHDLIVVGSGCAGLSAAYFASKKGSKVLVLEKGTGKESATFASTAEMNHDPDVDWERIISKFGINEARKVWKLTEDAMRLLEVFAHRQGSEHFETARLPAHLFSYTDRGVHTVKHKYEIYKNLGAKVTLNRASEIHSSFTSSLTIHNEGRTNNQALLRSLRSACIRRGARILNHSEVAKITQDTNFRVKVTDGREYYARRVIVATGGGALGAPIVTESVRTFVVRYKSMDIPPIYKKSLMWDVNDPFHYIRTFAGRELWIGGEDKSESVITKNIEKRAYESVGAYARQVLKLPSSIKQEGEWSGTFFPSKRSLPLIGIDKRTGIEYSIGFGGSGLVMSFISGFLHEEWRNRRSTEYCQLFGVW